MKPQDYYKKQAGLLLSVLPEVARETSFALHGGTAINLFHSNMPRLSVDIDLTYLPVEDREASLAKISESLNRIAFRLQQSLPLAIVDPRLPEAKIFVTNNEATIKIEVNTIKRGCYSPPEIKSLCQRAQKEFDVFCEIRVVDKPHLFGGKICAALDRQHPRDIFDIMQFFKTDRFDKELKKGFIFYLVSSGRPLVETLFPNLSNQRPAFENQFSGMTQEQFAYEDFENTRLLLIEVIQSALTAQDKNFLLGFEQGNPNWEIYDFSIFPAVQWKLQNIQQLRTKNSKKHKETCNKLEKRLAGI